MTRLSYRLDNEEYIYFTAFNSVPMFFEGSHRRFPVGKIESNLKNNSLELFSEQKNTWEHQLFYIQTRPNILYNIRRYIDYDKLTIYGESQQVVKDAWKNINKIRKYSPKSEVGILRSDHGETHIDYIKMQKPKLDIKLNYGSNFEAIHNEMVAKLNKKSSGLFLLHGNPGTGKTTYIKYLMSSLKRRMIIIPNSLIGSLDGPQLLSLMYENKNAILILEDAETVLQSREDGNSVAPTLINLSDGILGSVLNISLICTFNVKRNTIDEALLRKGRLLLEHEFGPLEKTDAQKLLDHLGKSYTAEDSMTLAEIYNCEDDNKHEIKEEKKPIGFK